MQSCTLNAPGKINFYLEITGKRSDGFHSVVLVLQSVELSDRIHLRLSSRGIRVACDRPDVPTDASNLAYRAATLLQTRTKHGGGVDIQIEKRIPVAAGMAGGSTDAAAVLVGLNQLWNLGLTVGELQELAAELGSDVPFCVQGGTMLAFGRGEQLSPLPDVQPIPLLLAKPRGLLVSAGWAYRNYDSEGMSHPRGPISRLLSAIAHRDPGEIAQNLYNDLEPVVFAHHAIVREMRDALLQSEALGVMMSGSGPTVFALMPSLAAAAALRDRLCLEYPDVDVWVTQTSAAGIAIAATEPASG
jgi:4-diphosphocytidyl-2-C-methyl-D-erythritol kinase